MSEENRRVRVGLIGVGAIADYVHVPAIQWAVDAELVAIADPDHTLLQRRQQQWRIPRSYTDPTELLADETVDAVIIATPNDLHAPLAIAAARHRKHVLCEKPLALSLDEAVTMLQEAAAAGICHMTAFTYRFVPAMRFLKALVESGELGTIRHFRSQRFQDWPETSLGWRQYRRTAGSGELADMASHRIDFGHYLIGPIAEVCGALKQFVPRDRDAHGHPVAPSDTDDWVAFIGLFANGATGVWESTKLARGRGSGGKGHDFVELNGSKASAIYELRHPYRVLVGSTGGSYREVPVPEEFLKHPESRRNPREGDPERVWRWDQDAEFIAAIRSRRPAVPSFADGAQCQAVMEAVQQAWQEKRWVQVREVTATAG